MNIFVLDENPELAARYHCNSHVVKMQLETAQLLSTAYRYYHSEAPENFCYKATHKQHPCSLWARESRANFVWLVELYYALEDEWRFRYNHPQTKRHGSYWVLENITAKNFPVRSMMPDRGLTPFVLAMPDSCKDNNPVLAYRKYYREQKQHLLNWGKCERPYWLT